MCYVDTHTHILPMTDDGSWSMEESKMLAWYLYQQGVRHVLATPHSEALLGSAKDVRKTYQALKEKLEPKLSLHLGCEILCDAGNIKKTIQMLKDHKLPTMNGTNCLLVEFIPSVSREDLWHCLFALKQADYIPIIAHYERYHNLKNDLHEAKELKRQTGCLLQLNASCLMNVDPQFSWASVLINEKLIDMIGSDCHNTYSVPPHIKDAADYLNDLPDPGYREWILSGCAKKNLQLEG